MRTHHILRAIPVSQLDASSSKGRLRQALQSPLTALVMLTAAALLLPGCSTTASREAQSAAATATPNVWSSRMDRRLSALTRASAGTGIAVARTPDNQLKLLVPVDASFESGGAELKPAMRPVLDLVGEQLDPHVRVTIIGHTDGAGPNAINDPLSMDRAEAVREYLVNHGVRRGRLLVEGRGAREPLATNATEAGRAANRRVEIFLSQPGS